MSALIKHMVTDWWLAVKLYRRHVLRVLRMIVVLLLVMMVLASWTTNVSNLYSSSLGLGQAFPRAEKRHIVLAAGIVGLMVSLAGIRDYFVDFLIFLGVLIPPIAGVYIYHALAGIPACRGKLSFSALGAWMGGAGLAMMTSAGWFTLTGVPALDSLFAAVFLYLLATKGRASRLRSQP